MSIHAKTDDELERTDKLPQLDPETIASMDSTEDRTVTMRVDKLRERANAPAPTLAALARMQGRPEQVQHHAASEPPALRQELSGIRGKIADLEGRLRASEEHNEELTRQRQQLESQSQSLEARLNEAQAKQVRDNAEAKRHERAASDAEQRLTEMRVRFETQLADVERQLVEARTRGDKRITRLEQQLTEEATRAADNSHSAAEAKLELERLRLELRTAQVEGQALQARVAEQTKAAADIARLFAQQSSESHTLTGAIGKRESELQKLAAAKAERDRRIAVLETEVSRSADEISRLRGAIETRELELNERVQEIGRYERRISELLELSVSDEAKRAVLADERQDVRRQLEVEQDKLRIANTEIDALKKQLTETQSRLATLEQTLDALRNDLVTANRSLQERNVAFAEAEAQVRAANEAVSTRTMELEGARQALAAEESTTKRLREELDARARELEERVKSFAGAEVAHAALLAERDELLKIVPTLRERGERLEAELNAAQATTRRSGEQLTDWQTRYEEAAQTVSNLRTEVGARDARIAALEARLSEVIKQGESQDEVLRRSIARAEGLAAQLNDRDEEIVELNRELEEHANALASIRRDIDRIGSEEVEVPNLAAIHEYTTPIYTLRSVEDPSAIYVLKGQTVSIGRSDDNDIAVKSTSISRYHARLMIGSDGVMLADLQSTNGCYVNGKPIKRQMLSDGDAVMIGKHRYRFSVSRAPLDRSESVDEDDFEHYGDDTASFRSSPPN